jgi:hypothetical protein
LIGGTAVQSGIDIRAISTNAHVVSNPVLLGCILRNQKWPVTGSKSDRLSAKGRFSRFTRPPQRQAQAKPRLPFNFLL